MKMLNIKTIFSGDSPNIRNVSIVIVLFGVLLISFVWAGIYYKVQNERQLEIEGAFKETSNFARAFEEHTLRTIKNADQVVLSLKYQYEKEGRTIDILQYISEGRIAQEPFVLLSVIDENGDLVASSQTPFVSSNLKDREHFLVHKDYDSGQLFISKPVLGRSSGKWSIQMTRRVNKPDGSFGGVAVVSVDPFYFSEFYKQVDLGEKSTIALIGRDGIIRARKQNQVADIGRDVSTSPIMDMITTGKDDHFIATSPLDGVNRIYSYRALKDYPLMVLVGVNEQKFLEPFKQRVHSYCWVVGTGTAVFSAFIGMLLVVLKRQKSAEEALKKVRDGLRAEVCQRTQRLFDLNEELIVTNEEYVATNKKLKYTNKALEQSRHELIQRNEELNEAFKTIDQTQNRLVQQEKLAAIGQLAAGVAHEINNPLGFVTSNVEMLEQYFTALSSIFDEYRRLWSELAVVGRLPCKKRLEQVARLETEQDLDYIIADLPELFRDTLDGLDRMSNIVKGMQLFAYVDKRHLFQQYDLNAGLESTLLVAHNEIKQYATIEKSLGRIPTIEAVGSEISQVLLNLIVNAAQAIKEKHSTEMEFIKIVTWSDNRFVYCTIEDSGVGISSKNLNNIFEPFFTTKQAGQGTGLGLSISNDIIVNRHNGELLVQSTQGKGAKFTVKLPIIRHYFTKSTLCIDKLN